MAPKPTQPPNLTNGGSVHPQSQSRFLSLAGELRTQIYEYVLTVRPNAQGRVYISRHEEDKRPRKRKRHSENRSFSVLALLQTCRLVHSEAAAIFYDLNHLSVRSVLQFTRRLSDPRLASIKRLTIHVGDMKDVAWLFHAFQGAFQPPNLSELTLRFMRKGEMDRLLKWSFVASGAAIQSAKHFSSLKKLSFEVGWAVSKEELEDFEQEMEDIKKDLLRK